MLTHSSWLTPPGVLALSAQSRIPHSSGLVLCSKSRITPQSVVDGLVRRDVIGPLYHHVTYSIQLPANQEQDDKPSDMIFMQM